MNKNTKFEIGGRSEFLAVIDEIGDLQVAIEGMKAKVRHRLEAAADWALAHPAEAFERGGRGATAKYDYALKAAARSLRRLPDVSQEQAVALLSADGTRRSTSSPPTTPSSSAPTSAAARRSARA